MVEEQLAVEKVVTPDGDKKVGTGLQYKMNQDLPLLKPELVPKQKALMVPRKLHLHQ